MEENINIAEILKDKPQGTKLYSILSDGECFLNQASEDSIYIDIDNRKRFWCFTVYGSTHSFPNGCVLLFPSREMRDWHKFAWKKGDVLISNDGKKEVFFNGFTDDTYALFKAKHGFEVLSNGNTIYLAGEDGIATSDYTLGDKDTAQNYINTIEERLGGKLNRETLKIEPAQPEFKDGDIVTIMPRIGDKLIYLFKEEDNEKYYGHAFLDGNIAIVNEDSYCQKDFCTARPSTDEEKQQLFDALEKEGKAWDAEKKMIVDLKPKVELKPFDKVLVRDFKNQAWTISIFGFKDAGLYFCCNGTSYQQCIPYKGNESLLGETKDVEGQV